MSSAVSYCLLLLQPSQKGISYNIKNKQPRTIRCMTAVVFRQTQKQKQKFSILYHGEYFLTLNGIPF